MLDGVPLRYMNLLLPSRTWGPRDPSPPPGRSPGVAVAGGRSYGGEGVGRVRAVGRVPLPRPRRVRGPRSTLTAPCRQRHRVSESVPPKRPAPPRSVCLRPHVADSSPGLFFESLPCHLWWGPAGSVPRSTMAQKFTFSEDAERFPFPSFFFLIQPTR